MASGGDCAAVIQATPLLTADAVAAVAVAVAVAAVAAACPQPQPQARHESESKLSIKLRPEWGCCVRGGGHTGDEHGARVSMRLHLVPFVVPFWGK